MIILVDLDYGYKFNENEFDIYLIEGGRVGWGLGRGVGGGCVCVGVVESYSSCGVCGSTLLSFPSWCRNEPYSDQANWEKKHWPLLLPAWFCPSS